MNDDESAATSEPTPQRSPTRLHGKRVWVAGHRGMVGAALVRRLARERAASS